MTPAEKRGSALDQRADWKELPFVSGECAWAPLSVPEDDKARGYAENWSIGLRYAMEMVEHLRDFSEPGDLNAGEPLSKVIEAMVKRGKFDAVERAFLFGVGQYIATKEIGLTCWFNATMPDDISKPYD